jgi:hypothetical protein
MTPIYRREDKNKSFDSKYEYCDRCIWNGVPNQKIILIYLGIRSADEPGFIQKFLPYEYLPTGAKLIHHHRFDAVLIQRGVNSIFQSIGTAH